NVVGSDDWGLLLEYPLRRLGRRPDAVILAPGVIIVVEFKIGGRLHDQKYADQALDYALCIRDFHRAARGYLIVPVGCAEHAPQTIGNAPVVTDFVGTVILTNALDLKEALRLAASTSVDGMSSLDWRQFDIGGYSPTPTIVEAARAVYAGHS